MARGRTTADDAASPSAARRRRGPWATRRTDEGIVRDGRDRDPRAPPAGRTRSRGSKAPTSGSASSSSEVARAARYKRPLTVVLVELGDLGPLASSWGVEVARHAVREAAQCLQRHVPHERLLHAGSAETRFGVVLTETDEIAAINFVERVREAGPKSMPKGFDGLQFSFGWASPKPGESADAVVRRADARLRDGARRGLIGGRPSAGRRAARGSGRRSRPGTRRSAPRCRARSARPATGPAAPSPRADERHLDVRAVDPAADVGLAHRVLELVEPAAHAPAGSARRSPGPRGRRQPQDRRRRVDGAAELGLVDLEVGHLGERRVARRAVERPGRVEVAAVRRDAPRRPTSSNVTTTQPCPSPSGRTAAW